MTTYVYEVTTIVTEQWFIEGESNAEARERLFDDGEVYEGSKSESIKSIELVDVDDD